MKVHLISDTHFNHKALIDKLSHRPKDFEMRLYDSLSNINDEDLLIHLGDICIGNDIEVHTILSELSYKKILIKGNHDKKSNNWYLEHGWDFVCEMFIDTYFGKKILFSHAPQQDLLGCDYNVHGHCHDVPDRYGERTDKHILIAIEHTNYQPVLLNDKLIK